MGVIVIAISSQEEKKISKLKPKLYKLGPVTIVIFKWFSMEAVKSYLSVGYAPNLLLKQFPVL